MKRHDPEKCFKTFMKRILLKQSQIYHWQKMNCDWHFFKELNEQLFSFKLKNINLEIYDNRQLTQKQDITQIINQKFVAIFVFFYYFIKPTCVKVQKFFSFLSICMSIHICSFSCLVWLWKEIRLGKDRTNTWKVGMDLAHICTSCIYVLHEKISNVIKMW